MSAYPGLEVSQILLVCELHKAESIHRRVSINSSKIRLLEYQDGVTLNDYMQAVRWTLF